MGAEGSAVEKNLLETLGLSVKSCSVKKGSWITRLKPAKDSLKLNFDATWTKAVVRAECKALLFGLELAQQLRMQIHTAVGNCKSID